MNVDHVRLPSGEKPASRGVHDLKGGGHNGSMTGATVASAIVFLPAAPLFLFMHGKDITIPKGHEATVYTNSDYSIPSAGGGKVSKTGAALTNADVLELKSAGLSERLTIDKIKGAPEAFSLETDDLLALKTAGLSDAIISAMIESQQQPAK